MLRCLLFGLIEVSLELSPAVGGSQADPWFKFDPHGKNPGVRVEVQGI